MVSYGPGDPALFPELAARVVLTLWSGAQASRDEWIEAAASYGYRTELLPVEGGWLITIYDDGAREDPLPLASTKPKLALIGTRRQTLTA